MLQTADYLSLISAMMMMIMMMSEFCFPEMGNIEGRRETSSSVLG